MKLLRTLASDSSASGSAGWGLFVLRIGMGFFMLFGHGVPKLMSFSERAATFHDPFGLGSPLSLALVVFAEVFCAALVVLGIFTRLASIPILFTMAVVVFVATGADFFGRSEMGALFAIGFTALLIGGGGNLSLGRMLRG